MYENKGLSTVAEKERRTNTMKEVRRIAKIIADIVEVVIPTALLLMLFAVFVLGVFFRYIMQDPQPWTYELSTICFLSFVILSACYVQRVEKHIMFDMVYNAMCARTRCLMRIVSNAIVTITCALLTPATVKYLLSMKGLTSQVLKIPRTLIFLCFLLLFCSTAIRSGVRTVIDVAAFAEKSYECRYIIAEEDDEV